jgi:hypothetical protein
MRNEACVRSASAPARRLLSESDSASRPLMRPASAAMLALEATGGGVDTGWGELDEISGDAPTLPRTPVGRETAGKSRLLLQLWLIGVLAAAAGEV